MSAPPPVTIRDSEAAVLRSSRTGRAYAISLAYPTGAPTEGGVPALYLLDGDRFFGTLTEAVRARCHRPEATGVVPAAIVGISPDAAETRSRTLDFTPGPSAEGGTAESGGAADFGAFIEEDLKPFVAARIALDRERQALIGHSLGGYFVLHTLMTKPDAFRAYVAISPSIWWDRALLFDRAESMLRQRGGAERRRVMITVGEYEQPPEAEGLASHGAGERHLRRRMIDNARALAGKLGSVGAAGPEMRFHELAGEDHASTVPVTLSKCLRFVLAPR